MQFVIIGRDHQDTEALGRRMAARPEHLVALKARQSVGQIIEAGALVGDTGEPVGSLVLCEFPDRAAVDTYLAEEPYVCLGVWATIEVTPLRLLRWEDL